MQARWRLAQTINQTASGQHGIHPPLLTAPLSATCQPLHHPVQPASPSPLLKPPSTTAAPHPAHLNVLGGSWCIDEDTGTLDDEVDVHLLPGQLGGVAGGHHADLLAVDADVAIIHHLDVGIKLAQGGVVLQQVAGLRGGLERRKGVEEAGLRKSRRERERGGSAGAARLSCVWAPGQSSTARGGRERLCPQAQVSWFPCPDTQHPGPLCLSSSVSFQVFLLGALNRQLSHPSAHPALPTCLTPPESLMAMTSRRVSLPRVSRQRRKLRPMRPKPGEQDSSADERQHMYLCYAVPCSRMRAGPQAKERSIPRQIL